jgi:hypothetical protein
LLAVNLNVLFFISHEEPIQRLPKRLRQEASFFLSWKTPGVTPMTYRLGVNVNTPTQFRLSQPLQWPLSAVLQSSYSYPNQTSNQEYKVSL